MLLTSKHENGKTLTNINLHIYMSLCLLQLNSYVVVYKLYLMWNVSAVYYDVG